MDGVVTKFLWNKWGMFVIGAVLLAIGLATSGGEVMCDGKPMSPDDTCSHLRKRRAVVNTFEEEKFHQSLAEKIFIASGGAFIVAGVVWTVVDRRRKTQRPQ